MVKNLLRVHLLLCMDSYAECSIRLVLEVIRVSVHHQEYMAEIIIRHMQIRVKGRVSSGKLLFLTDLLFQSGLRKTQSCKSTK